MVLKIFFSFVIMKVCFSKRRIEHICLKFLFIYWLCHTACGVLVPSPGANLNPCNGSAESYPRDGQGSPIGQSLTKVCQLDVYL